MFDHVDRFEAVKPGQKPGDLIESRLGVALRGGVDFDAIAGRKQHGLNAAKHPAPAVQRLAHLLRRKRQPLSQRDRRAVMAATDHLH